MNSFEYSRPEPANPEQLSGLSNDAKRILIEQAGGQSTANQILSPQSTANERLNYSAYRWASKELDGDIEKNMRISGALDLWREYQSKLTTKVPDNLDGLIEKSPNLKGVINRLYEAKIALLSSGETVPSRNDISVGETMRLVVIPWQEFKNHEHDFEKWIRLLRKHVHHDPERVTFSEPFRELFLNNHPMYRVFGGELSQNIQQLARPQAYLDQKIAKDGAWGLMLMQSTKECGVASMLGSNPDDLTDGGAKQYKIGGYLVDNMGVFEWIALTLDQRISKLPDNDSWLLANFIQLDGKICTARGSYLDNKVTITMNDSSSRSTLIRPRLAVA